MFLLDYDYYFFAWFFTCAHIQIFIFLSNLFNYRFPYCIRLCTWSTQQVIVAQHMCWFQLWLTESEEVTRGFNKGHSSKSRAGSPVWQTSEEVLGTYRPKRCGNNNKNEDNSPKTLNDKNHQASSQKSRQQILFLSDWMWDILDRRVNRTIIERRWSRNRLL